MGTYESFVSPELLFRRLVERYIVPRGEDEERDAFTERTRKVRLKVFNFVKKLFAADFSSFSIPPHTVSSPPTIWDWPELAIARQLSLYFFDVFKAIRSSELLNQSWAKPKYHDRAPNLLKLIAMFNDIGLWLVGQLLAEDTLRPRAALLNRIVQVCFHLKELNNFYVLIAVMGAISNSAILRLKFTRAGLSRSNKRILAELEELLSPEQAYKAYSDHLKSINPPAIPILSTFLQDLTMIDEGNEDEVDGLVNFGKRQMEVAQISKVQLYQNTAYNFERDDSLMDLLARCKPSMTEKELYAISLEREPRGAEKSDVK